MLDRDPINTPKASAATRRPLVWYHRQADLQAAWARSINEAFGWSDLWQLRRDGFTVAPATQPGGQYRSAPRIDTLPQVGAPEVLAELAAITARRASQAAAVSAEDAALVNWLSAYVTHENRQRRFVEVRSERPNHATPTATPRPYYRQPVGLNAPYDVGVDFDPLYAKAAIRVDEMSAAIERGIASANELAAEAQELADFAKGRYVPSAWTEVKAAWADVRAIWKEVRKLIERRRNGFEFLRARRQIVINETKHLWKLQPETVPALVIGYPSAEYMQRCHTTEEEREAYAAADARPDYDTQLMEQIRKHYGPLADDPKQPQEVRAWAANLA